MNRIQKAATLVIALTITLLGATLAAAPMAVAGMHGAGLPSVLSVQL
jgi:hypothetical protein